MILKKRESENKRKGEKKEEGEKHIIENTVRCN